MEHRPMSGLARPELTLIPGGQERLWKEIIQDLLHFRSAEARRKCDRLSHRGSLRLVGGQRAEACAASAPAASPDE